MIINNINFYFFMVEKFAKLASRREKFTEKSLILLIEN